MPSLNREGIFFMEYRRVNSQCTIGNYQLSIINHNKVNQLRALRELQPPIYRRKSFALQNFIRPGKVLAAKESGNRKGRGVRCFQYRVFR